MRYLYEVGYHTLRESEYVQLRYPKQLTGSAFDILVIDSTVNACRAYEAKSGKASYTFQDVFPFLIEELRRLGFEKVKFNTRVELFGWAWIKKDDQKLSDWNLAEEKETERFIADVRKELVPVG